MNRFVKAHYERLLLALVAVSVLANLGWFWWARSEVRRIKATPVTLHFAKSNYVPVVLPSSGTSGEYWSKPTAQPAGAEWLYELFTPPVVFYDHKTAMFSVTAPSDSVEIVLAFPFELIAVKRELYRLQLTGYFGEAGAYTAAFNQTGSAGTLLAREGGRFQELGLILRRFSIKRVAVAHRDAWPAYDVIAQAEMYDERAKATVMLDNRTQKFADAPVATIRISGSNHPLQDMREGDSMVANGCIYKIGSIQDAPATLTVTRESPDGSRLESKVLRPAVTDVADAATAVDASKYFPIRPATGIVTHDK